MEPDSARKRLALLALLLLAAPARPATSAPVEDGMLAESFSSRRSFADVLLLNMFFAAPIAHLEPPRFASLCNLQLEL